MRREIPSVSSWICGAAAGSLKVEAVWNGLHELSTTGEYLAFSPVEDFLFFVIILPPDWTAIFVSLSYLGVVYQWSFFCTFALEINIQNNPRKPVRRRRLA